MHTVFVISVHFICKYQNEAEQQNSFRCSMQRHPMSNAHVLIAVNRFDRAASNPTWSVDLLTQWFQIFLICGNLLIVADDSTSTWPAHHHMLLCVIAVVLEEKRRNK